MNEKSSSCFNSANRPLTEYFSFEEALENAEYLEVRYGKKFVPYKCNRCNLWHLSPKERRTKSETCHKCKDRLGKFKELYFSFDDAKRRAEIILKEKKIELNIYQCPYSSGWHLTKK